MSVPVRFEMDRRAFGVVTFPRARGQTRIALSPLTQALQSALGVRVKARKRWWFGRKHFSFDFMGETVKIQVLDSGDAVVDLGGLQDEARETLLEHLRLSHAFVGR